MENNLEILALLEAHEPPIGTIHQSIVNGDITNLRKLLRLPANRNTLNNSLDSDDFTALMIAVKLNNVEIVDILVKHDADQSKQNKVI